MQFTQYLTELKNYVVYIFFSLQILDLASYSYYPSF
jgi:hypothetical protein